jgi:hypothetical protein
VYFAEVFEFTSFIRNRGGFGMTGRGSTGLAGGLELSPIRF